MKKSFASIVLWMCFFVGLASIDAKATVTVATFADPSRISSNPLFTVDFTEMKLTGGWGDNKTGLNLEIPYNGHTFADVWFDMSDVEITSIYGMFGQTGAGVINFYENGASTNPLVTINFQSGAVSRYGFGADEIFVANTVTISGSQITDVLSEEMFSFSFANLAKLPGHTNWTDGFNSTAAFTSSAFINVNEVPEPATICILGLGVLCLIRRKKINYTKSE